MPFPPETPSRDSLPADFPAHAGAAVEWAIAESPVAYEAAVAEMESRRADRPWQAAERVWLVEHPPLYTAGTSAKPGDLLEARFPVFQTGRGGQFTYHGPGQRVAYVMLDLKRRERGRARLRRGAGGLDHRHAGRLQRHGRTARGPRRRLGAPARQGARPTAPGRGQDRGHRHPRAPLGELPRHRAQRRAGPVAFRRHRAVRRRTATASPAWSISACR